MAEQDLPRTPVLGATITEALKKGNLGKSNFLTSRVNWTIQSSGVDYLHLLIVSMNYLIRRYDIKARLAITIHDEIRYLVKEEDRYRAALALQISNLWTRAMFCQQLGIDNVPQSCAFFSLIDIDHVLRKEVDLDCVTPSHPTAIPSGEAIDIYDLLKKCPSLEIPDIQINKIDYGSIPYVPRTPVVKTIEKEQFPLEYLRAQITPDEFEAKSICNAVRRMNSLQKAAEKRKMSAAIRAEKRAEKRAVEAEMKAMVKAVRNAAKPEIKLNTKKKFEGSKKRFSESHRMAQMM
jgi:DNA polymerase gamma 1